MGKYLEPYIQNIESGGSKMEQALIRRWWKEENGSKGIIVWEYTLNAARNADAIWFPDAAEDGKEYRTKPGREAYPLNEPPNGAQVVLCEAKADGLTPALVGQGLVHTKLAELRGANVVETRLFFRSNYPDELELIKYFDLAYTVYEYGK